MSWSRMAANIPALARIVRVVWSMRPAWIFMVCATFRNHTHKDSELQRMRGCVNVCLSVSVSLCVCAGYFAHALKRFCTALSFCFSFFISCTLFRASFFLFFGNFMLPTFAWFCFTSRLPCSEPLCLRFIFLPPPALSLSAVCFAALKCCSRHTHTDTLKKSARCGALCASCTLFLQEIKYFCVAAQTKWRCQAQGNTNSVTAKQKKSVGRT